MDRRAFLAASAALFAAPQAAARTLGGTPVALVTADLESRIVAVHLGTGHVHRTISTPPGPRSIESLLGTTAVVAHTAHGAVSIVDGPRLEVRDVVTAFDEPRYTAAGPGGRYAFVTDSGAGSVVCLDVLRGRVAGRVRVGGPARHLSYDPKARRVWAALGTRAERIAVVDARDPRRLQLLGRIRAPFLAHDVAFAPGSRVVWVTSGDRRELALFDRRTLRAFVRLPAGAPPQHVTFAGGLAFVTSGDDGSLRVHDARSGRLVRQSRVPVGSYNVAEGWGVVFSPSLDRGTLCVADRHGRVDRTVRVARSSHDACFVMAR